MTLVTQALRDPLNGTPNPHPELIDQDNQRMVHFPRLLNDHWCDAVANLLRQMNLTPYEATTGSSEFSPIPKLGPALFEYHDELGSLGETGLRAYFEKAAEDDALLRLAFAQARLADPLDVIHHVGRQVLGLDVAVAQEGIRRYFSGVVRDINAGAIPHHDDASFDTPTLTVGRTNRQLSVLLYLSSFTGGALTSYNIRPSCDLQGLQPLGYGYTWDSIATTKSQCVQPDKGSVVIFNPRYVHSVAPVGAHERRLTISAFVGRTERGNLISWS